MDENTNTITWVKRVGKETNFFEYIFISVGSMFILFGVTIIFQDVLEELRVSIIDFLESIPFGWYLVIFGIFFSSMGIILKILKSKKLKDND